MLSQSSCESTVRDPAKAPNILPPVSTALEQSRSCRCGHKKPYVEKSTPSVRHPNRWTHRPPTSSGGTRHSGRATRPFGDPHANSPLSQQWLPPKHSPDHRNCGKTPPRRNVPAPLATPFRSKASESEYASVWERRGDLESPWSPSVLSSVGRDENLTHAESNLSARSGRVRNRAHLFNVNGVAQQTA